MRLRTKKSQNSNALWVQKLSGCTIGATAWVVKYQVWRVLSVERFLEGLNRCRKMNMTDKLEEKFKVEFYNEVLNCTISRLMRDSHKRQFLLQWFSILQPQKMINRKSVR